VYDRQRARRLFLLAPRAQPAHGQKFSGRIVNNWGRHGFTQMALAWHVDSDVDGKSGWIDQDRLVSPAAARGFMTNLVLGHTTRAAAVTLLSVSQFQIRPDDWTRDGAYGHETDYRWVSV